VQKTGLLGLYTLCLVKRDLKFLGNIDKTRSVLMKFATWFSGNHVANFIRIDRVLWEILW